MNAPTPRKVSRRHFLSAAAIASVAAAAPTHARAGGTFARKGHARLNLSLAAYSFRKYFAVDRGKPNDEVPRNRQIDLTDFVDFCAEHGCDGAELTSYYIADVSDASLIALRRHSFLSGIGISGTAIGNNFSVPRGPERDEQIATTKLWIDRAATLGAPHIRVFAGRAKGISRDDADKLVIEALEECCDYAGKKGIFLGLENHDSISSADKLIPMVKAVKSPWIGINLDSGNFLTEDPYDDFARSVPYAVNVQLKTEFRKDSPGGAREADLKRFTQTLRNGGYQGWVALEYEAAEDPYEAIPRYLDKLRSFLG